MTAPQPYTTGLRSGRLDPHTGTIHWEDGQEESYHLPAPLPKPPKRPATRQHKPKAPPKAARPPAERKPPQPRRPTRPRFDPLTDPRRPEVIQLYRAQTSITAIAKQVRMKDTGVSAILHSTGLIHERYLSPEERAAIQASSESDSSLATRYDVGRSTIWKVRNGKTTQRKQR